MMAIIPHTISTQCGIGEIIRTRSSKANNYTHRKMPWYAPRSSPEPADPVLTRSQVFHNIDYFMLTIRLLSKDYAHLAKCMIPIGDEQLALDMAGRVALLKRHTRRFTEEEIKVKFSK
jgi:hypothetical protein